MYLSLADIDLQLDEPLQLRYSEVRQRHGRDRVNHFWPLNMPNHRVKYFDHYLGKLIVSCAGSSTTPL